MAPPLRLIKKYFVFSYRNATPFCFGTEALFRDTQPLRNQSNCRKSTIPTLSIYQWTVYTWKADSSSKSEAKHGGIWRRSCASPPVLYVHGCMAIYLTVRVGDWGWRTRMASNSAIFGFTFWLRNWLKSAFHVYIVHWYIQCFHSAPFKFLWFCIKISLNFLEMVCNFLEISLTTQKNFLWYLPNTCTIIGPYFTPAVTIHHLIEQDSIVQFKSVQASSKI